MLRSTQQLQGFAIGAVDGPIGEIKDFYVDDQHWVIRYFVVETGPWFAHHRVLVSPISVHDPDWQARLLPVSINQNQVMNSPGVDEARPVSRQFEQSFLSYYGYPEYWSGLGLWGQSLYPYSLRLKNKGQLAPGLLGQPDVGDLQQAAQQRHRQDDPHLRSCHELVGYHLHACDGEVGTIAEFLVEEHTWAVRYFVIKTGHAWAQHHVLMASGWITQVHWPAHTVHVDLPKAMIQSAPGFVSVDKLSRDLEEKLHLHYQSTGYWHDGAYISQGV
jgi:hypothetical protein